ncbi:MAG: ATP-binding protein [Kiritimatiellia bacterium]
MFTRILHASANSFFLFGPRGTGKSTWLRQQFPNARWYDLLDTGECLRLSREPGVLYREAQALSPGSWVVMDEVQKVPQVLNEVHRLIEERKLRFVLSGSSARKLRRGGTNLLAGRAQVEHLFPLVSDEVAYDLPLPEILIRGTLPMTIGTSKPNAYLTSYAHTYIQEEVRAEALTRNIGGFSRFLEIAARQNGQVTNVSGIARDAAVSRQTVQNYFDIMVDTLLGQWLQPWKLKRATKQVAHPKFFLFDCGVARALSGRLPYPPTSEELGPLLETWLLGELMAHIAYRQLGYTLHFWRSPDGVEVDFLCETAKGYTAIEVKAAAHWDSRYLRGLTRISEELGSRKVTRYGVFLGSRVANWDGVLVLPVLDFLRRLWHGDIL